MTGSHMNKYRVRRIRRTLYDLLIGACIGAIFALMFAAFFNQQSAPDVDTPRIVTYDRVDRIPSSSVIKIDGEVYVP